MNFDVNTELYEIVTSFIERQEGVGTIGGATATKVNYVGSEGLVEDNVVGFEITMEYIF